MRDDQAQEARLAARARLWTHRAQRRVCDRIEPWNHRTVYRASRYPRYWTFNLLQVRNNPGLSVDTLIDVADVALEGLEHRRIDFDSAPAAEPLRAEFAARDFQSTRLVWMHFEGPRPEGAEVRIQEVLYDDVDALRVAWHQEDFPAKTPQRFMSRRARSDSRWERGCWPSMTPHGRSRSPRSISATTRSRSARSSCCPSTASRAAAQP